ncbi:hypothetical protein JY96_10080 [Aquabacterium sp. NJ1]|nr:hypothetical protein JY96_10080 [Aquabacterium sp. NJ1]
MPLVNAFTGDTSTYNFAHRTLANLANKQSYNAIRLWLGGETPDFNNIALIKDKGWSPSADINLVNAIDDLQTIYAYRDRVRGILKTCEALNMGVILVCGYPGGTDLVTYGEVSNASTQANCDTLVGFWKQCIQEFGAEVALIGIDPLNEPPIKTPAPAGVVLSIKRAREAIYGWPQIAQKIIDGIRTQELSLTSLVSPTPIVICCPTGEPLHIKLFNAPSTTGGSPTYLYDSALGMSRWSSQVSSAGASGWIVYQFHAYQSISITSQGVSAGLWPALGWTYPSGSLRRIARNWDSAGNWVDDSANVICEDWGGKVEPMNNMDDVATQWREPIALQAAAQAGGNVQPIFVGEFSFVQPVLESVSPPNPDRVKLVWVDNQKFLAASVTSDAAEQRKYLPQWADVSLHPRSRWITEFDVFQGPDGTYVRAYFDNINRWSFGRPSLSGVTGIPLPPVPPTNGKTPTKRGVADCPVIRAEDYAMGFAVPATRTPPTDPDPRKWAASNFTNDVLMTISAGEPGTEAFFVTKAKVQIQADRYWVEYKAPNQAIAQGFYRAARDTASPFYPYYAPIAIASFFSATSGDDMEKSRAAYIQDILCVAQKYHFSWAYHAYGWSLGFIGWTPGGDMSDVLMQAAMGRQLPRRA